MEERLERVNIEIKNEWGIFRMLTLLYGGIFLIFCGVRVYQNQQFINEYKSTTWYVTEAELTRSSDYYVTNEETESWEIRYNWYYSYVGKDGKTYTYTSKGHGFEGRKGSIIQIYVDEADDSHCLKKEEPEDNKRVEMGLWGIIGAGLIVPYVLIFAIIFLVLYRRRSKIMRELGRR